MTIEVNNGRYLQLTSSGRQLRIKTINEDGETESLEFIPEHEVVMLLNYWRNCKNGLEKSDYIKGWK